jgi:pimeloyl-ACP methyl ester carboxylesterase
MPTFRTRGFGIHYEVHGDGPRLPLLLVMGMGGTCQGWLSVTVPDVIKTGRPCVIFDNRGAGQSEDPGGPFTTSEMSADAHALLDHLGIARAHVLGGFLGGMIAQELALAHPQRVASLILAGTYARADAKRRLVLDLWKTMVELKVPAELRIKQRLIWTLGDATMEQEDLIEAMWRFYLRDDAPMEDRVFVRQAEACIAHDALERIDKIAAATLVVCGEGDILTPPVLARELVSRIKDSRLVLLPNAGHLVAAELAPRFNRLVNRFLAEQELVEAERGQAPAQQSR